MRWDKAGSAKLPFGHRHLIASFGNHTLTVTTTEAP